MMTSNNPDSKAPGRIWASAGSYPKFDDDDWCNASCSNQIEIGVEYTRTDAITPQQAAKVLLGEASKPAWEIESPEVWCEFMDRMFDNRLIPKDRVITALKALAESKE